MTRLFGTDGVRGRANQKITAPLALRLGAAAAHVLTSENRTSKRRPTAIIGRDPRVSGEMLAAALAAGMASQGVDVLRVGVLPTPAVAYLTDDYGADMGVMISASHNPMPDNGIKFFAAGGKKLADVVEDEIEATMSHLPETGPTGHGVGRVLEEAPDARERYLLHLNQAVRQDLTGIKVVVDCANGAASEIAPLAYEAAGAEVIAIHNKPNSYNINDECGSTHMDDIMNAVREHGADLGLAHDGDADRCLAVDAEGNLVDGDEIMAILAIAMEDAGKLTKSTLVATVMSNLGLQLSLKELGIKTLATQVGDRYVLEELARGGYALGGEQSGHIVMSDFGTTGDGVLTGLSLMARMAETKMSLRSLADAMKRLPQHLINVPVKDKSIILDDLAVQKAMHDVKSELGENGRVLLRPSGTEELFRVMVEAPTDQLARDITHRLAQVVASVEPKN
ncbi:phosphoglucosamine mutase [Corynebacterium aquilae]|uniref:Phosphoglucosamine mutase n=1 Tax=Corynebacterium aquilae DSM 44791 TaxID=1431546 RepID=A0A1L7CE19_9CORY|nr:phosphoglucosamine mutase [Corynebacterium aquilae]APT84077.1 phosphoglucosamine mutase [Corynebacterium aquilae DSM 44791]